MKILDGYLLTQKLKSCQFETIPDLLTSSQLYNSDFMWNLLNYDGCYGAFDNISLTHLLQLKKETAAARIPITDFYGSNSGKSDTKESLDAFASSLKEYPRDSNSYITLYFETDEDFVTNITSIETRYKDPYPAYQFEWNGNKYLGNEDQSHHIAAVYRQCKNQNRNYEICCNIKYYSVNASELKSLSNKYSIYAFCADQDYIDSIYLGLYAFREGIKLIKVRHLETFISVLFFEKKNMLYYCLNKYFAHLCAKEKAVDIMTLFEYAG